MIIEYVGWVKRSNPTKMLKVALKRHSQGLTPVLSRCSHMDEWLSGFAYRTDMSSGVFIVYAAIVAIIAFLTITLQSYKIAMANPINKLRNE